jgi:hypothetical protein
VQHAQGGCGYALPPQPQAGYGFQQPQQPQFHPQVQVPTGAVFQPRQSSGKDLPVTPQQQQQQQQPGQQPMGQPMGMPRQYHTYTPLPNLGPGASPVNCPSCGQRALTRISYSSGSRTQLRPPFFFFRPGAELTFTIKACGRSCRAFFCACPASRTSWTRQRTWSTIVATAVSGSRRGLGVGAPSSTSTLERARSR